MNSYIIGIINLKSIDMFGKYSFRFTLACILAIGFSLATNAQGTGLGDISFPTSCKTQKARDHFLQGALLLHSFEYEDAAEAFRKAQDAEPDFAMAYWGEAMTYNHPIWMDQDAEKGREVLARLGESPKARSMKAPTQKEKDYLKAVEILYGEDGDKKSRDYAYSDHLGAMHAAYPEDHEIASFYALSILGTSHNSRETRKYMKAASIVEEVFAENPAHPGALHYLIHSYDDPVHAPLGLRAARRYAKVAPNAAHALHMPSHIFVAIGDWDRVVASNEESYQASIDRIQRKGLSIEKRGYHSFWWLQYGYLQQGRMEQAMVLLDSMKRAAKASDASTIHYHLTMMRAGYLIETGNWDSPAVAYRPKFDDVSDKTRAVYEFTSGYVAFKKGNISDLEKQVEILKGFDGSGKVVQISGPDPAQCCAVPTGKKLNPEALKSIQVMRQALQAMLLYANGDTGPAITLLEAAASTEESLSFMFGPPVIAKPTLELLGEWHLEQGNPEKAIHAFTRALIRAPGRTLSVRGLAQAQTDMASSK